MDSTQNQLGLSHQATTSASNPTGGTKRKMDEAGLDRREDGKNVMSKHPKGDVRDGNTGKIEVDVSAQAAPQPGLINQDTPQSSVSNSDIFQKACKDFKDYIAKRDECIAKGDEMMTNFFQFFAESKRESEKAEEDVSLKDEASISGLDDVDDDDEEQDDNVLLREKIRRLKLKIVELRSENSRIDSRMGWFEDQFKLKTTECDNKASELDSKTKDYNKLLRLVNGQVSEVSEETVIEQFKALRSDIHNTVDREFSGHPFNRPTMAKGDEEARLLFESMTDEPQDKQNQHFYLKRNSTVKNFFFEGAIWQHLLAKIFNSPGRVYNGTLGQALAEIDQKIGKKLPEPGKHAYRAWLSSTGQFLNSCYGTKAALGLKGEDREEFLDNMVNIFGKFSASGERNTAVLRRLFNSILYSAHILATSMSKSKLEYVLCMTSFPGKKKMTRFPLVKDYMKGIHRRSIGNIEIASDIVDLVVTPALVALGNMAGEHFRPRLVSKDTKAQVVYFDDQEPLDNEGDADYVPGDMGDD